ncbi:MAG TPA: aminoacyl-tRNA hydrolase [Patescibacteria group bacterium]|nr:aminoacyl-tRNA hydrolase [Patescibacteria group bacterium]
MKLIIALGNPGREYEKTRHNAGWLALDFFLQDKPGITCESKFKTQICELNIRGVKTFFVKPQTFMNLSGQAVAEIVSFYKLSPETDILVIHDEIDLPLGEVRLSKDRSSAGHNGVQSLYDYLGTKNFSRIRIGIEARTDKKIPPTVDYVLHRFTNEELTTLSNSTFPTIAKEIERFLET